MRNRPFRMTIVILLFHAISPFAQTWVQVDPQTIPLTSIRDIIPQQCVTYQMDYESMKAILWTAPYDYVQPAGTSNTQIMVGLADGTADYFRMVQYEMMEAPLASEYPDIKTFRGVSISNPYRTIRVDWTKNGFRAVISDLGGKTYIDPFQRNDMANRVVYYADSFSRETDWSCGWTESDLWGGETEIDRMVGDCEFRSYRLALATTGEYSNYFGATSSSQSALVMSQVVTAVNRINEVYEVDFATRLILVANTDDVFYYDGGTDPYTNNDGGAMLGQNQTTIDNIIGSSNYDIGHVFSTGGGGVAYLNAICNNAIKAGGVTGSSNPVGDPFIIDYVAHEMGHQFGANHTQNNNCNRNLNTSMEPGSASTIMGYAGICPPDVQPNSDDYMHAISLQEINNRISSITCEVLISTENTPPVVSNVPNYTIPKSTPFVLTATAVDDEDDPLTYCWEQWDQEAGAVMPPASTNIVGPMFRSLDPTSSSSRYFPNITAIINGTNPTWEVLPSVGRSMEFRVTVRDLHDGTYGCTDEDNTIITVSGTAGPFTVSSQSSPTTWLEGENVTITWNVANTTASPVNCANVDIRLSLDGGLTYPTALSLNEPNDGSATVSVPSGTTSTGRVMVKGSGNVFFDINNANITINPGLPNFTVALDPVSVSECNDGSVQTAVEIGQFMGFTDPVTLSALNLPPGATATFVPTVVTPGSTSTLTINNLMGLFGAYTPTVRGTSTTGNKDVIFSITLLATPTTPPTLTSPANNTPDAVITPLLDWQVLAGVTQYEFQLAYDAAFNQIAQTGITLIDKYQITAPLIVGEQYYWRVRGGNSCGGGTWSPAFTFTTSSCFALNSLNVPIAIPVGTSMVTSTFDCPIDMVINDVDVVGLTGTHSWVDDLKFTLIAPDASERLIWDQPCGDQDNFNINFNDEASPGMWPCPPTNGLFYRPDNTLSFFDGKHSDGIWTLEIQDVYIDADGGSLASWGLKVCGTLGCQLTVNQTSGTGTGSLPGAISCAASGDTIRLGAMLTGQTINVGSTPLLLDKYLVILAEAPDINVTGSGDRIFEINSGIQVEFINVLMTAGTAMTGAAISNTGNLKLKDVTIESSLPPTGATLIHNLPGAQLFVDGNCELNQ